MSEETGIARQWIAKAKNDLLNADNNLAASSVPFDTVCFHCQQAAEKLLKAFLISQGISPPLTHDLLLLLELILPIEASVEMLRPSLIVLAPYAVEVRYPDEGPDPAKDDAQEARDNAEAVMNWIGSVLPDVLPRE